jgi:hypothetical protein
MAESLRCERGANSGSARKRQQVRGNPHRGGVLLFRDS